MLKMLFDTNVILDYFGCMTTEQDQKTAVTLVQRLERRGTPFLITPTILKDFQYLFASKTKQEFRSETGRLTNSNAASVIVTTHAVIETLMELCCIASEDAATCETARLLCKTHFDYENNLIAAVALRIDATCIVTRDKAFAKHCPVACHTPEQALSYLEAGVWGK